MKRIAVAYLAAAGLALASCGPTVNVYGSNEGQPPRDAPPVDSLPVDGQSPPTDGPAPALSWKASDGFFPNIEHYFPGHPLDPDALVLSFTNVDPSCGFVMAEPEFYGCLPEERWQFLFAIPPALDRPAPIDLADPRIWTVRNIQHADCSGGISFGNAYNGTLEILASDETSVTVQVDNGDSTDPFSGTFVATRCGAPPPPFVPSPAVAVWGPALTANPSSGTGPTAGADTLYLYFDQAGGTCADAHPVDDCTANRQMVLGLPPALQVPGEISLADPAIDAMYVAAENNCSTASPAPGTLTVNSISETAMSVRIYGSGRATFDGDYDVTICP